MVGASAINGGISLRPLSALLNKGNANIESRIRRRRYYGYYLESVVFR